MSSRTHSFLIQQTDLLFWRHEDEVGGCDVEGPGAAVARVDVVQQVNILHLQKWAVLKSWKKTYD